jgi:hypothetical protein
VSDVSREKGMVPVCRAYRTKLPTHKPARIQNSAS